MAKAQPDVLQSLVDRLREIRKQAGGRLGHVLADASVREHAAAVADKIEDLRVELTRSLRHARPAARPPAKPAARPAVKPAARPAVKPAARSSVKPAPGRSTKALGDMTVQELRHLATERHIAGRSSMSKAELVKALGKK
jgi:Rho termination factor, N-terminal domain